MVERLLDLMNKSKLSQPRIIQVCSTFHYGVKGDALLPSSSSVSGNPKASEPSLNDHTHRLHGYANSKYAQILYMHKMNNDILPKKKSSRVRVYSTCPGSVRTDIHLESKSIIYAHSYAPDVAIKCILRAMFSPEMGTGGKVMSKNLHTLSVFKPFEFLSEAKRFTYLLLWCIVALPFHNFMWVEDGVLEGTSPPSYNKEAQDALYDWSKKAISKWL